eukprot:TRINITY_DN101112_c0_g1_i1.p1 TRINITY_DN101112_c0_g1~~TRINITY_DN101112_c0_g1_i1.p1  ORF type:complete len:789 (+),score=153.90 TRINITY_DN101112_c0_g1_i1:68-2434(+)
MEACHERLQLCVGLLACAVAATQVQGKPGQPQDRYDIPELVDYDCTTLDSSVLDWNAEYDRVLQDLRNPQGPQLELPEHVRLALNANGSSLFAQCPLGCLYFYTLSIRGLWESPGEFSEEELAMYAGSLARLPFFITAASRWPVYEVLQRIMEMPSTAVARKFLTAQNLAPSGPCLGAEQSPSGVDWPRLHSLASAWTDWMGGTFNGTSEEHDEAQWAVKVASEKIFSQLGVGGDECMPGYLFLLSAQCYATAFRDSSLAPPYIRVFDDMFPRLATMDPRIFDWPTLRMISLFGVHARGTNLLGGENLNDDVKTWGDLHPRQKQLRHFADIALFKEELAPYGMNASGWEMAGRLADTPVEDWLEDMPRTLLEDWTGARPLFQNAVACLIAALRISLSRSRPVDRQERSRCAAFEETKRRECGHSGISEESCSSRGCCWSKPAKANGAPWCFHGVAGRRKLVLLTAVWGKRWAKLIEPLARWAAKAQLPGIVIVAMGEEARMTCSRAAALWQSVVCWSPLESSAAGRHGSLMQKFPLTQLFVQLGVDTFIFDFDTVFLRDPSAHLERRAGAAKADVAFVAHFDSDCLNTGGLYFRSSAQTAEFLSKYLAWLHQHPYEDEQRALNCFLNFTKQRVSFKPKDLPEIVGVPLDEANSFASSRGGWLGSWSEFEYFHFVFPLVNSSFSRLALANLEANYGGPMTWQELKVVDIRSFYELVLDPAVDVSDSDLSSQVAAGAEAVRARAPWSTDEAWLQSFSNERKNASLSPQQRLALLFAAYEVERPPSRSSCW